MQEQFARTELLLGPEAMAHLRAARVAVFGLGGVGSFAVEALARSGVGALDLIDHDDVSLTNLNRQLEATLNTIGRPKVEACAERIASINPDCHVRTHKCFYLPDEVGQIDFAAFDYVVDAVDTITGKLLIIQQAQAADVPVISCMGTAFKLDPTAFTVADIYDTSICPLAKIIRKECRKRGIGPFKVVYSTEPARTIDGEATPIAAEADMPISRHGIAGSVAFVPGVAGLIAASEVIRDLAGA